MILLLNNVFLIIVNLLNIYVKFFGECLGVCNILNLNFFIFVLFLFNFLGVILFVIIGNLYCLNLFVLFLMGFFRKLNFVLCI